MVDYKNGKIYKIVGGGKTYYGSTCVCRLSLRLAQHYYEQNKIKKYGGKHCVSQEILDYDDCEIILVELFPCNTKDELRKREGEYIRNNECINQRIAGRTKKEYTEDNKDLIAKKHKQYHYENRASIIEKKRENYQKNKEEIKLKHATKVLCECGIMTPYGHLSRHRKSQKHIKLINKQ